MSIISDLIERHAREIPVWGHLPAAMRLKRDAVARVGATAAFDLVREALQVPGLDYLVDLPATPMSSLANEPGVDFRTIWPGGGDFLRPSPRVVGGSAPPPMPGHRRAGYLVCLDNAVARGRSSIVIRNGKALVDGEGGELTAFPDNPEYDPGVLHAGDGRLRMMRAHEPALRIDEAFWLAGSHTVDFGHWITEYLPKLMLARLAGLPEGVPVLVDSHIPGTIRDGLPLLLPPGTEIINVPHLGSVEAGRLWFAPTPMYAGFYATDWDQATWAGRSAEPERLARLMQEIVSRLGTALDEPTGLDRLFLARKPSRHKKKLLNHPAIEALARERGFRIVYPEDYSLVEQLRMARHARHIIAPEGSNGLLAFFARPGTRVCALSPPYTYPLGDIGAILEALGVDFEILLGPDLPTAEDFCAFWNDYRIDEATFAAHVDRWLEEPVSPGRATAGSIPAASS